MARSAQIHSIEVTGKADMDPNWMDLASQGAVARRIVTAGSDIGETE